MVIFGNRSDKKLSYSNPLKVPGVPKKVHKFKIIYLCSENQQITKLCFIYQTRPQLKF